MIASSKAVGQSWIRSPRHYARNFVNIQISTGCIFGQFSIFGLLEAEDRDADPFSATNCAPQRMLMHRSWSQWGMDDDARCITRRSGDALCITEAPNNERTGARRSSRRRASVTATPLR